MRTNGLHWTDTKISGGPIVEDGQRIVLMYKIALSEGDLRNNRLLESTFGPDLPVEVKVTPQDLLRGVYIALLGMHAGGSIRVARIPSSLAFGEKGFGPVPPNATLFVELCVASIISRGDNDL